MNELRGTGISGLKGIEPIRENKYIRPLIECERDLIEKYCEKNRLNPRIDKTNFINDCTRNKIRNVVLPYPAGATSKLLLLFKNASICSPILINLLDVDEEPYFVV